MREQYDQILIDCPPALNMLTVNALVAADSVLVPMQCEYYALEGLSALVGTIEQIRASVNPDLEVERAGRFQDIPTFVRVVRDWVFVGDQATQRRRLGRRRP